MLQQLGAVICTESLGHSRVTREVTSGDLDLGHSWFAPGVSCNYILLASVQGDVWCLHSHVTGAAFSECIHAEVWAEAGVQAIFMLSVWQEQQQQQQQQMAGSPFIVHNLGTDSLHRMMQEEIVGNAFIFLFAGHEVYNTKYTEGPDYTIFEKAVWYHTVMVHFCSSYYKLASQSSAN
ncbi:hypothetical protein BKA62DRAFT_675215 [Auriculariales sp. MPI-PUGE-AT-0066]|nr:hypothetical protein BKA62DRAFT_675215 [Auriculariales sp. MPI-PUGE-AT-0066]